MIQPNMINLLYTLVSPMYTRGRHLPTLDFFNFFLDRSFILQPITQTSSPANFFHEFKCLIKVQTSRQQPIAATRKEESYTRKYCARATRLCLPSAWLNLPPERLCLPPPPSSSACRLRLPEKLIGFAVILGNLVASALCASQPLFQFLEERNKCRLKEIIANMGTREVYEEKLRTGNLYHDPTINPGLGSPRCPRCLSLIKPPSSGEAEWTITSVLHDAAAVAGSGAGAMLGAVHGFNTGPSITIIFWG